MNKYANDVEGINALCKVYGNLFDEISKKIYGQDSVVHQILIALFSGGHCLLIGVPGLAKTLIVKTISEVLSLDFKRIQFTPDLMPSDIIGTEILNSAKEFQFVKGPIFANIILADEINRTPPKTQAALLEAMQEHSVTSSGTVYPLDKPFFVLATQNPIEQEGTYPLPEAQLDRFMFSLWLDYPTLEGEIEVVKKTTSDDIISLESIVSGEEIRYFQKLIRKVPVNDSVVRYAVSLVAMSRPNSAKENSYVNKYIRWGAGPRASQYLILGAKTHAALHGKFSPDIEDVDAVAKLILRHRIIKNYLADAEKISIDDIIDELMKMVKK